MAKSKPKGRKSKRKVHATSGSTFDVSKWFWWILTFLAGSLLFLMIMGRLGQ